MIRTIICCGKGGVGKTVSAVSLALFLSGRGEKTAIIDYDGGHSVGKMLEVPNELPVNLLQKVHPSLHVAVLENAQFLGISEWKRDEKPLAGYFRQFPQDLGILPLADMTMAFFGVPTDMMTAEKIARLIGMLHQLEKDCFVNVVIDVEPTRRPCSIAFKRECYRAKLA